MLLLAEQKGTPLKHSKANWIPQDVHVERNSAYSEYFLGWTALGYRFHMWLSSPTQLQKVLFKNPLRTDLGRSDEGYFSARYLDPKSKLNSRMINFALKEATEKGLFQAADDKIAAKERQEQMASNEQCRLASINAAALELYEALEALVSCLSPEDNDHVAKKARAALAKARGEQS